MSALRTHSHSQWRLSQVFNAAATSDLHFYAVIWNNGGSTKHCTNSANSLPRFYKGTVHMHYTHTKSCNSSVQWILQETTYFKKVVRSDIPCFGVFDVRVLLMQTRCKTNGTMGIIFAFKTIFQHRWNMKREKPTRCNN